MTLQTNTTPLADAAPTPDGFIMDGLSDGRLEYKRGSLGQQDSTLRSCSPVWEARTMRPLLEKLSAIEQESGQLAEMNTQLREQNEQVDRINNELRAQVDILETKLNEVLQQPWPEWATSIMKTVREHSGYDGYDDAEGVDLPEEVREHCEEMDAAVERERAERIKAQGEAKQLAKMLDEADTKVNALRAQVDRLQGGEPVAWRDLTDGEIIAIGDRVFSGGKKWELVDEDQAHMVGREFDSRVSWPVMRIAAKPAAPELLPPLAEADLTWLKRFKETTEDDQSYDVPKDHMTRLVELGALRWCGGSRYAITAFGEFAADPDGQFSGSLPLKTYADHMATCKPSEQPSTKVL